MVHHLAYYAGWPNAVSAVPVLATVFEARSASVGRTEATVPADLTIVRAGSGDTFAGDASNFTGNVEVGPLFSTPDPARLGGGLVRFEPGARTAWHTHPFGQTLYITEGCGWVQVDGHPVREVGANDMVVISPETRHWHGASASESMAHLALSEALDGTSVTWMEHVDDESYARGAEAERTCAD